MLRLMQLYAMHQQKHLLLKLKVTMKQFAVVRFDDDLVSEVPVEWLTDNDTYCWWPKSKNPTFLIKKSVLPKTDQPESWEKCHVQVETFCESYKVARNKAQDINYTESEDNQEIRKGKRKIFKKKIDSDLSSSEEEMETRTLPAAPEFISFDLNDQGNTVIIPLDGPPVLTEIQDNFYNNPQSNSNSENSEHQFVQNDILVLENAPAITATDIGEHPAFKKMMELLIEIKIQNVEILNALALNKQNENVMKEKFLLLEAQIPLKDINAFDMYLERLKSAEELEDFTAYINTIGGSCPKDYINRTLGRFISNELATKCSWLGLRNNKRLEGTQILEIIKDIVLFKFKNATIKEFEQLASEWLRHATQRLKRQLKA